MKRIACLMLMVSCCTILLMAADEANQMTGWLCDSKCVVQNDGRTACNQKCTEHSGNAVFIDDQGRIFQVANGSSWDQYMNKRVKGMATMDKDNPQMLTWRQLFQEEGTFGGGGGGH